MLVAGSAQKMPAGVQSAIEDAVDAQAGVGRGKEVVKQLEQGAKYQVEAWA